MTAFWILAPIMVIAALGLVLARKAVHCALCLAVVMISLAVLYADLDAPFLFAVQIIVYTGAIMMLFLFVLMLVGVDHSDSLTETIKGQRLAAIGVGLLFGITVVVAIGRAALGPVTGLDRANANGNPFGLAELLFGSYVLAFEVTSALLITAALGAMVLAHRERLSKPAKQADIARQRLLDFAASGRHPGNAPTPGVFARHNAVDTPALLPDGTPVDASVADSVRSRGQEVVSSADDVEQTRRQIAPSDDDAWPWERVSHPTSDEPNRPASDGEPSDGEAPR